MRALVALAFAIVPFAAAVAEDPPVKPTTVHVVHETAANAIAADAKFGGKPMLYSLGVARVIKSGEQYVVVGVGASSLQGDVIPGSMFTIKKGSEEPFGKLPRGQQIVVKAQYVGVSAQPGAWMGYVVKFDDAELQPAPMKK